MILGGGGGQKLINSLKFGLTQTQDVRTSPNLEENLFAPDCFSNKQHNEINSNNDNDMNHVHSNIG